MTAKITSRSIRIVCAALALTFLPYGCGPPPPPPPVLETLPARLTNEEFWNMITDFSEPGGVFPSDNFLSNEAGYQEVIPALLKTLKPGGAYFGVGPEQNFTYIVALQPKIAFIIDIRRQNMLEHLMYKALIELSSDRAEFLSRLFARQRPENIGPESTPEELFKAFRNVPAELDLFFANLDAIKLQLKARHGFKLSAED